MRRACLVCVICDSKSFHSFFILTLHNDCSHIEDVHLLFCTHFMDFLFFIFGGLELRIFSVKCLEGVWFVRSVTQ